MDETVLNGVSRPLDVLERAGGSSRTLVSACFRGCSSRGVGRAVGRGLRHSTGSAGALSAIRVAAAADRATLLKPDAVIRLTDWAVERASSIDSPPVWAGYGLDQVSDDLSALLRRYDLSVRERLLQSLVAAELATPLDAFGHTPEPPPAPPALAPAELLAAADNCTSPAQLRKLSAHRSERIRWHVAANRATPSDALLAMVDDEADEVRKAAAANPSCTTPQLAILVAHRGDAVDPVIAYLCAIRPHIGKSAAEVLARHPYWFVQCTLARNATVPGAARPGSPVPAFVRAAVGAQAAGYVPPRSPYTFRDLGDPSDLVPFRVDDAVDRLNGFELPVTKPTMRLRILRTAPELRDNARLMQNCTSGYAGVLRRGERVVIAIDDIRTGHPRYNGELIRQYDGWALGELKGIGNSDDVDPAVATELEIIVVELLATA